MPPRQMRVVLWGTGDTGKPRVRILRDGLLENGVSLTECRADIWTGIEDKSQVKGLSRWLRLFLALILAYPTLVYRYLRLPPHDWVLLTYPSIPDIFVIRLFARLRGARIAMDWFLSAYDTVVLDRALVGPRNPLAWLIWAVEWLGVRLADRVFMDTRAHARRMETLFRLPPDSCGTVWVGAEDRFFEAAPYATSRVPGEALRVLFYGQFIPLHGAKTIVEAARLLREHPVEWLLIGRGQEAGRIRRMLEVDPLDKVSWLEWTEYSTLIAHIHAADVCLGIFGDSDKAASVIPNKVFQVMAAGKPVVTRDSPAIRELPQDETRAMDLVAATDPESLASAILRHASRNTPPDAPRPTSFTPRAIGLQLLRVLKSPLRPKALPR